MTNAHSARDWCSRIGGEQGGGEAFRRGVDKRCESSEVRHRHGQYVRILGLGRRPLFHGPRSAFRPCWHRPGKLPCDAGWVPSNGRAFRTAPFEQNLPVLMGLLTLWYNKFFRGTDRRGIALRAIPQIFPGLSPAANDGEQRQTCDAWRGSRWVLSQTGPIYWGEPGTNGQHSFYQLIHQGTRLIPCDFIAFEQVAQSARTASRHAPWQTSSLRRRHSP